jgi:hypothetical protein
VAVTALSNQEISGAAFCNNNSSPETSTPLHPAKAAQIFYKQEDRQFLRITISLNLTEGDSCPLTIIRLRSFCSKSRSSATLETEFLQSWCGV